MLSNFTFHVNSIPWIENESLLQNPKLLILKAVIQRIPPHHVFKNIPDEACCQLVARINKEVLLEMSLGLSVDGFSSTFLLSGLKWA